MVIGFVIVITILSIDNDKEIILVTFIGKFDEHEITRVFIVPHFLNQLKNAYYSLARNKLLNDSTRIKL